MPLAVGVIALSAGLAVATFVKAFGVGFLARPRSAQAERASESPLAMLGATALAASGCAALALTPTLVVPALGGAVGVVFPGREVVSGELALRLAGVSGVISPLLIALALMAAVVAVLGLVRVMAARRARRAARLWDCGAGPMSARMEYTATSFAEPLQRVFDNVLAPESDVAVTPVKESAYLVERVRFQARVPDRIEHRLYDPLIAAVTVLGLGARKLATGSVHRYLGYGFWALTGALIVLVVLW